MDDCVKSVAEGIKNYIEMPHSGALMISGPWGCGKTYYYEHTIVPLLEEKKLKPLKVSLFGITDISAVYDRIKEEYYWQTRADEIENNRTKGIFNWLKKNKENIDEFGKTANEIDSKFDPRNIINLLYRFRAIPTEKVVLCFDDLERAISSMANTDTIMGIINELVENRHFKVLVIANEKFMHDQEPTSLRFKEKVIEKTLYYEPDIKTIIFEIARKIDENSQLSAQFIEFINNPLLLESIDPYSLSQVKDEKLKENLKNLRNLKFTLSHYYKVFSILARPGELLSDADKEMLLYAWFFSLGITISYKNNQLTDIRIRSLVQYPEIANTVASIDFGFDSQIDPEDLFQDKDIDDIKQKEKEEIEKESNRYAKSFYNTYIKPYWKKVIWVEPLYSFLTKGINFSSEELKEVLRLALIEKDSDDPASKCINGFLQNQSTLTDDVFSAQLRELHGYLSKGELTGYMNYLNASYILLYYRDILGIDEETVKNDITKGIQCFSERCESHPITRSSMEMVKSEINPSVLWVHDIIMECISKREKLSHAEAILQLNDEFSEGDMTSFCRHFCVSGPEDDTPELLTDLILHEMDLEIVKSAIQKLQAPQISLLDQMLRFRFIQQASGNEIDYTIETPFVLAIKDGLGMVDYSKPKYSNYWMHHLDSTVTNIIEQYVRTE